MKILAMILELFNSGLLESVDQKQVLFWIIGIILVVGVYITALCLSKKTSCVIIYGWKDIIMLSIVDCVIYMALDSKDAEMLVFAIPFFAISMLFSLVGNTRGSKIYGFPKVLLFTALSIVSKFILIVVIPLIFFGALLAAASGKKDKRYRDGTKNNERSANIALVSVLTAFLFRPLIKSKKDL